MSQKSVGCLQSNFTISLVHF